MALIFMWDLVKGVFGSTAEAVEDTARDIIGGMFSLFSTLFGGIMDFLGWIVNILIYFLSGIFTLFIEFIDILWDGIILLLSSIDLFLSIFMYLINNLYVLLLFFEFITVAMAIQETELMRKVNKLIDCHLALLHFSIVVITFLFTFPQFLGQIYSIGSQILSDVWNKISDVIKWIVEAIPL